MMMVRRMHGSRMGRATVGHWHGRRVARPRQGPCRRSRDGSPIRSDVLGLTRSEADKLDEKRLGVRRRQAHIDDVLAERLEHLLGVHELSMKPSFVSAFPPLCASNGCFGQRRTQGSPLPQLFISFSLQRICSLRYYWACVHNEVLQAGETAKKFI